MSVQAKLFKLNVQFPLRALFIKNLFDMLYCINISKNNP